MSDVPIPFGQWQQFCESFTRQHHGWLVSLKQIDSGAPDGAASIPQFDGYRTLQEVREGSRGDSADIMVTVGEGADEVSFLIEDTVALYRRTRSEADSGLRIDTGNGMSTLVEFRSAAAPESLDGAGPG